MGKDLVYKRAETPEEIEGSLRLRYEVFCKELGDLPESDCPGGLEQDEYDPYAAHFIIKDAGHVVGNTRVVAENQRFGPGTFGLSMDHYYDLAPLKARFRGMAEMGRTCFLPPYRGRASLARLWQLVYRHVDVETGCDLGLSMGACWTDDPGDMRRFYALLEEGGFLAKGELLKGKPGLVNTGPSKRRLTRAPFEPFKTAPALKMYLDVGFRIMGEPVYVEHFHEYQMLVGCHKNEVLEPYLSVFKALPKSERRRASKV